MSETIDTSRISMLSAVECEEILYSFDKCMMIGLTAPIAEINRVRSLLRERVDILRKEIA